MMGPLIAKYKFCYLQRISSEKIATGKWRWQNMSAKSFEESAPISNNYFFYKDSFDLYNLFVQHFLNFMTPAIGQFVIHLLIFWSNSLSIQFRNMSKEKLPDIGKVSMTE